MVSQCGARRRGEEELNRVPTFRLEKDMHEVSAHSRPDLSWSCVDPAGHRHCWWEAGVPAQGDYHPSNRYTLPTLVSVVDCVDEDGYEYTHYECKECHAEVEPQYRADTQRYFVPGRVQAYVAEVPVSRQEFEKWLYLWRQEVC